MAEANVLQVAQQEEEDHDKMTKLMNESNKTKAQDQKDESSTEDDDTTERETIVVSNMIKLSELSNSILSRFVYRDKAKKEKKNEGITMEDETNDHDKLDEMMNEAQTALNVILRQQHKKQKQTHDSCTTTSVLQQIVSDIQQQGGTFVGNTCDNDDPWKTNGMIDDGISSPNDQIRGLHLGGDIVENLVTLPLSIFESTIAQHLITLDLSKSTHLTELPETLGNFKSLRTLNLTRCISLQRLPSSIGCCLELQHLILTDCEVLSELPNSIDNLTKLRYIKFGANVTSGCNALTKLPETLGQCKALIELDLTKCKFLQTLPNSIGHLTSLRELNLRECKSLSSLPETIGDCTNLRELSISKCILLKEIPSSITRLKHTLLHLNLSKCTGLPADGVEGLMQIIYSFTNLQVLNMRGCKTLTHLSSTIPDGCLQKLQHWDLKGCKKLQQLPQNMFSIDALPSLKMLDLRQCKSLVLSDSIKQEMNTKRETTTCTILVDEPVIIEE